MKNLKMNTPSDKIIYNGFKVRFASLTHQVNINNDNDFIEEICDSFSSHLPKLSEIAPGSKFATEKQVRLETGEMGDFIEFPLLKFTAPENNIKLSIIIRINPCFLCSKSSQEKHYSKIWINVSNKNKVAIGTNIKQIMDDIKGWCGKLADKVTKHYLEICSGHGELVPDSSTDNYWLSIDTLSLWHNHKDKDKITEYYYPMFSKNSKTNFNQRFNENEKAKNILEDLTSCLTSEKSEKILDIVDEFKQIEWKVRAGNVASVFYGQNSGDNFFHIVGAGYNFDINPPDSIYNIDRLFKPTVAGLISEL